MASAAPEGDGSQEGLELDRALERVAELLGRAAETWNVGEQLPPMSRFRGMLRELVVPPARLVLRVAQLVTRDQRAFNQVMVGTSYELREAVRALRAAAGRDRAAGERARAALEQRLAAAEAALRAHRDETSSQRSEVERRLAGLQGTLDQLGATVAQRGHQIAEALAAAKGEGRTASAAVTSASRVVADQLYADFEDQFRGAPELIRERAEVYLPIFRAAGAGGKDRPILDLGCGRGELLEVLRKSGMSARGADTSTAFVKRCRDLGLEVEHEDALSVLRRLPESALGAVTAIHVIEHLPLQDLAALVGESVRVLRPGGVALFETPNPKNLNVGAWSFYMDPTHVRPLPPDFMRHLMERAGFRDVKVLPAHPDPRFRKEPIADPTVAAANEMLFGPQDYAVVGTRP
ncbi:MAG TPA: class I SAM-dependent methyltransferase [Myxococcaceae bacterium]|jgi:SAM-dependent methyltransferase